MPSKNMLPKGQRRRTVKHEYRATRGVEEPTPPPIPVLEIDFDMSAGKKANSAPGNCLGNVIRSWWT